MIAGAKEDDIENDSTSGEEPEVDLSPSGFIKYLENRKNLSLFFNDSWKLIYHEDNRCDGSTDGEIDNLKKYQIDSLIKLQVKNDDDGWDCSKKEPESYEMNFDLRELVKAWNRFEMSDYEVPEGDIVYVVGGGESDYLKISYNDSGLIIKLEYRSEDPG